MPSPSFPDLLTSIQSHPQFNNQIKLKRLKKQLDILSHYQNPNTSIQTLQLSTVGIELKIKNTYRQSVYYYKMLLDFQYPFNRPMVFYLNQESEYAQAKDLLDILLQGSNWGPSLMLTYFLDKLQTISQIIREHTPFQSKQLYHINENYRKTFLEQMQISLFQVEEYTWRYMIKTTKKRYLGLNNETLIMFSPTKNTHNLTLDFWKPISDILTAKALMTAGKKFTLEISYTETQPNKQTKLYLGGETNIETILQYLNPIEMIERKITHLEKSTNSQCINKHWNNNTAMIKDFTQLIQHYSLKDTTKAEKYIKLMKMIIAKFYQPVNNEQQIVGNKKEEMNNEEIQT